MFQRAAILGIGLIGGSFGLALKERGLAREVWGVGRRQSTLDAALKVGACDYATFDAIEAVEGADLVFLAAPVGQMRALCEEIAPHLAPQTLVTDGGSTKAQIVADCEAIFAGKARFVGGHPMAGSEKTGVEAARGDLFQGAKWILTPTGLTDFPAFKKLEKLVEKLGAHAVILEPKQHDELLAVISHLPHLMASALVHSFLEAKTEFPDAGKLIAGGWRDSTRVAAGGAEMWRDIALANSEAIAAEIGNLIGELQVLQTKISENEGDWLENWLEIAARERKNF